MSDEIKPKKPRLKGFAKMIGSLVNTASQKEECKEFIKARKTRVLLSNEEDPKWAVIVSVINDEILVEGVAKEPNFKVKKIAQSYGAWAWWEFPNLDTMLGAGVWKSGKWIKKMAGKKTRGASQISIIATILKMAMPEKKEE